MKIKLYRIPWPFSVFTYAYSWRIYFNLAVLSALILSVVVSILAWISGALFFQELVEWWRWKSVHLFSTLHIPRVLTLVFYKVITLSSGILRTWQTAINFLAHHLVFLLDSFLFLRVSKRNSGFTSAKSVVTSMTIAKLSFKFSISTKDFDVATFNVLSVMIGRCSIYFFFAQWSWWIRLFRVNVRCKLRLKTRWLFSYLKLNLSISCATFTSGLLDYSSYVKVSILHIVLFLVFLTLVFT